MATPTTLGGYPKQDQGENQDAWGTDPTEGLNNALDLLSEGIHSVLTITVTGDFALSSTQYRANQYRRAGIVLTGSGLTADPTITVPSLANTYRIMNRTGRTVRIKTSAGAALSLPNGIGHVILCDAVNMILMGNRSLDQLDAPSTAISMGGQQINSVANATSDGDAVPKRQMDAAIANANIPAASGAVRVSSDDTTARFLGEAVEAGQGIALAELTPGGDETLRVSISDDYTDEQTATMIALTE